jgi:hypothetical protein
MTEFAKLMGDTRGIDDAPIRLKSQMTFPMERRDSRKGNCKG